MDGIKRRTLFKGAAAVGAAAGAGAANAGLLSGLLGDGAPTVREEHNVVIIGSGFGGGVAALRLAQAGAKVTVLERGRWWETGPNASTFPSLTRLENLDRALWYETTPTAANALRNNPLFAGVGLGLQPHAGLLEPFFHPNLTVLCASGVGGGSLAYQGMTLQPGREVFDRIFGNSIDYDEMNEEFYPRVASMLQVETAPDELINTPNYNIVRAFKERAETAGYDVEKIPMPIDWSFALREIAGEMNASYSNGDCTLGVNNGGKHSVDVTYIRQAIETGNVTVNALHNVKRIVKEPDGQWTVYVDHTDLTGTVLEHKIIRCSSLIMAAGSTGTQKLLLRAAANNDIPGLPAGLGQQWGSNADRIFAWTVPTVPNPDGQGGPVVYGSKEWDDPDMANTVIQASVPPISPLGLDTRTAVMVGFGYSEARGSWSYNRLLDNIVLDWPREADWKIHQRIIRRVYDIAGTDSLVIDSHLVLPMTWHPLGGANIGLVCDTEGRVAGQEGLYVLDGALVPGNTGACNPSMTIAAVAERATHYLLRSPADAQRFGVTPPTNMGWGQFNSDGWGGMSLEEWKYWRDAWRANDA